MRRFALILLAILLSNSLMARQETDTLDAGATAYFVENLGQWHPRVRYELQLHDGALFLEDDGLTVALRTPVAHPGPAAAKAKTDYYRVLFDGARPTVPEGLHRQECYNNYYLGDDPSRWRTGVGKYLAARYDGLYPGVTLELYGGRKAMKYNFIVAPQADPTQIALLYKNVKGVTVDSKGSLLVRTAVKTLVEVKPYVFQVVAGREQEVGSRWKVEKVADGYRVSIALGDYDPSRELVIDPTLIFSTYTGSGSDNWGTTATYDSEKNVYTAGLVFGVDYPVTDDAYDTTYNGNADIGIFKFDSTGSQQIFATYLGGNQADMPHSMYVNSFDELVVFGTTGSANFPTTLGAFCRQFHGGSLLNYMGNIIPYPNGSDIFVSRFSADGSQLQASTFVGGSGNDGLNYRDSYNSDMEIVFKGNGALYYNYGDGARGEIITDDLNNVYVGTTTFSVDMPVTPGCVQPTPGGQQEGLVFKLDYNLRNMLWCTYLGGEKDDAVYSIDVDTSYNVVVCGGTASTRFPTTPRAYQRSYRGGTTDGFVTKIAYHGNRIISSSYLGSNAYDQLYFVRIGRHNEVMLFGQTKATGTTMIYNAGYGVPGAGMLLVRLKPDFSARVWSTVFGTSGRINLSPTAFAADICNRVYAAGWGRDFAGDNASYYLPWYTYGTTGMEYSQDAYSDTTDGQDFYILSLDAEASQLDYATFFGEPHDNTNPNSGSDHVDGGTSRFDKLGTLYQSVCASCRGTHDFPTTAEAWSRQNGSGNRCNNALFRFSVTDDSPVAEFQLPPSGCAPYSITFNNTGRGESFQWHFGDGGTSTERNPTHTYTAPGTYTITLIAYMVNGCTTSDTQRHTLIVLGDTAFAHAPEVLCDRNAIQIGPRPALGATYRWSGDPVSDPNIANPWVDTTGTYILRTTAGGCTQTDTFEVHAYTLVDEWQLRNPYCHDSLDGGAVFRLGAGIDSAMVTVSVVPDHPVGPYYTSQGRTYFALDNLSADTVYRLSVEGYGCLFEKDIALENPPKPHYTKEYSEKLCDDGCGGWIHLTWDAGDTLMQQLCTGTYVLQLTDQRGCPLVDTSHIVRDHDLDSLRLWADADGIYLGQSVQLHAATVPPVPDLHYVWEPAADLDRADIADPVATPTDTMTCYTATVSDGHCRVSDTLCIHCIDFICGAPEFFIPNAFTPNDDGINDRICFNADPLTDFSIYIYNRWGQCVYHSDDASQCWDGTYDNARCLAGVYTYTCHIRCHNGQETHLKGDITLIR